MEKKFRFDRVKTVCRFGKRYWPLFMIAEICILISYAVALLLPLNLTFLTDKVLYTYNYSLLDDAIRNYIILFVVAGISNFIYAYVWQNLNNHYIVDVKNALFEKTIFAKSKWLSNMNSGDIMSRIDTDSEQFLHIVQRNVFHFINSAALCIGIIVIIWNRNQTLAILLIAAALLPIIITRLCGKWAEKYSKQSREITGTYSGRIFEILKGIREIKLLCAEWWAKSQVLDPLKKLIKLGNKIRRVDFAVNKSIYLVNLTVSIIIYWVSVQLIMNGNISIGIFLSIIEYTALLHKKMNWMLRIYLDWFSRKVSVDRVKEVLNVETESDQGESLSEPIQNLAFDHVTFGYQEDVVLNDISFEVHRGEKVAIVGSSGVGKTTITGLIMKYFEPQKGRVLINGQDSNKLKIKTVREKIGMMNQDIFLFQESIRYNLLLGNPEYTDGELLEVCDRVGLGEIIRNLPHGLDSKISKDFDLSGGQKQRIMIARILLKNVDTIILDEATSALDITIEGQILKQLSSLSPDTTMLIISHRLEAIRHCDKIIVLDKGKIVEIGTHNSLIQAKGIYYSLFGGKAA